MMADLEEREKGDTAAIRTWLLRASAASPDPAWICADCGSAWDRWSPVCGQCNALGTLHWGPPARARASSLGLRFAAAAGGPETDDYDDGIETAMEAGYLDGDDPPPAAPKQSAPPAPPRA